MEIGKTRSCVATLGVLGIKEKGVAWQLLFGILFLALALPAQAQTAKSFTFHTDATSGDGTEQDITGLTVVGVTLTGSVTSNRSATFEVADSVGTFTALKCFDIDTQSSASSATLNGAVPHRFQCPVAGFKKFRVRISGGSIGTLTAVGLGLASARGAPTQSIGGGSGNVSNSGTPTPGQIAQWIDDTHIGGLDIVPPTKGGSGANSLPSKGVLIGQGTQPFQASVPTANSQCFMSAPANFATTNPSFQDCPVPTGGSTNVFLDLGNDASLESVGITQIAVTGDTNNIFTESSPDKLLVDVSKKWPTAGSADALSTNGANCVTSGQFAAGVSALGAAEGCNFPSWADLIAGTILSKAFLVGAASTFGPSGGGVVTANALTGAISLPGGSSIVPGAGDITANHLSGDPRIGASQTLRPISGGIIEANEITGLPLSDILTQTNTVKVRNKQNVPRKVLQTIASNAFTINVDTTDIAEVPALAADVTVNISAGTGTNPEDYQDIDIVFAPTSAPRGILWNAAITERVGMTLPTATTGDNLRFDMVKIRRFNTISGWVIIAKTMGLEPGITTLGSSTTYTCPHLVSRQCKMTMTGAAGTVTIAIPSGGTPTDGKQLILKIMCTNLQTITLTTGAGGFIASPNVPITGITCPAAGPSWTALGVEFSSDLNLWQLYATN